MNGCHPDRRSGGPQLQTEDEAQTILHISEGLAANATSELKEEVAIDRDDLRYIRHSVFRQARSLRRERDVPWGIGQTDVGGQDDRNDGAQTTPTERIALEDQDGTAKSRL